MYELMYVKKFLNMKLIYYLAKKESPESWSSSISIENKDTIMEVVFENTELLYSK